MTEKNTRFAVSDVSQDEIYGEEILSAQGKPLGRLFSSSTKTLDQVLHVYLSPHRSRGDRGFERQKG